MQSERPLLVIEAPGKARRLLDYARDKGWQGIRVQATGGRLYDLPDYRLGVDPRSHVITERIPCSPSRLQALERMLGRTDSLWVMTDPDDEGDWIAEDIHALSERICPNIPRFRVVSPSLDDASLTRAFASPSDLKPDGGEAARARRVFDRELGFLFSSMPGRTPPGEPAGIIGRVLTPCLARLADSPPTAAHLVRELPAADGGAPFEALVSVPPSQGHLASALADSLARLPASVVVPRGEPLTTRASLWTGPEAVSHLARELCRPVQDVANSLQALYEKGRVTYPRTESRALPAAQAQALARLAERAGARGFSSAELAAGKVIQAHGDSRVAHTALLPLDLPRHAGAALASMDDEDQVLSLLCEQVFRAGTPGAEERIEPGRPDDRAALACWTGWAREQGLTLRWYRRSRVPGGLLAPQPVSMLDGLCRRVTSYGHSGSFQLTYASDQQVLQCLIQNDLGRPSTVARHATAISARYLTRTGALNRRATQALARTHLLTPSLLDPEKIRALNRALTGTDQRSDHVERVAEAMVIAGLAPAARAAGQRTFDNDLEFG